MTCHSQTTGRKTVDDMAQTCWDDEQQHEGVPLPSQQYNDDDGNKLASGWVCYQQVVLKVRFRVPNTNSTETRLWDQWAVRARSFDG